MDNKPKNGTPAPPAQGEVIQMAPEEVATLLLIDLSVHTLSGAAHQVRLQLQQPGIAGEIDKAVAHLIALKNRLVNDKRGGIVLASPADMPPPKPH